MSVALGTEDHWVVTDRGRLFARSWHPPQPSVLAPIVLLHDSLGCVALWRDFPARLAEATGRRVIAYDRLGFGWSDARSDALDAGFVGEEAALYFPALRSQLGLARFVLFGHSVGGGMAVNCAARVAEGCEALITESAQVFVEDRTRAGIREAQATFDDTAQFDRLVRLHGGKARWVLDAWVQTWLSSAFADWSLAEVLPQVRCPVLVLHGEEDEYGSRLHPETIAGGVAGPAQMALLPGARHVPHREQEAWVLARVAGFLDSLAEHRGAALD